MNNVHPMLPRLVVNQAFITDFLAADAPAVALGMVEERRQQHGFLAMYPDVVIPSQATQGGFRLGHSLLGTSAFLVVHFSLEFYGFTTYNVLVNPNNPVVRAVFKRMVERPDYFIFLLNPNGQATAFQAAIEQNDLVGLKANLPRVLRSTTTDAQYQEAVAQFQKHPLLPGRLATWVCRDNVGYLDLTKDRLEMTPSGSASVDTPPPQAAPAEPQQQPNWQPLSMLPTIAMILDEGLESAEEQLLSMQQARTRPAALDAYTIRRVKVLYTEQLEFTSIHREQLERWLGASPSQAQRKEISRLTAQLDRLETVLKDILALAKELETGTIDAILRMDDDEQGEAIIEGRMPSPAGKPSNDTMRLRELRALAAVLDARAVELEAQGIHDLDLLGEMALQMPLLKRMIEISSENELTGLSKEYPGFYRIAKLLELIATGIPSGGIPEPR
jgi:hypothetical protein